MLTCRAIGGDLGETCGINHRTRGAAQRCPVRRAKPGPWSIIEAPSAPRISPSAAAERARCAAIVRTVAAQVSSDSTEGGRLARILRQIEGGPHADWCASRYLYDPCNCGLAAAGAP